MPVLHDLRNEGAATVDLRESLTLNGLNNIFCIIQSYFNILENIIHIYFFHPEMDEKIDTTLMPLHLNILPLAYLTI